MKEKYLFVLEHEETVPVRISVKKFNDTYVGIYMNGEVLLILHRDGTARVWDDGRFKFEFVQKDN